MALVKFGAGVSEIRGKEGGVIYSRNAYGAYMKTKVTPVNPQTQHQLDQRTLMGNLSQAWAGLATADKASWENLGAQVTRVNRFGDTTYYTGFGIFMKLNRMVVLAGGTANDTAPAVDSPPILEITNLTADSGVPSATMVYTPTPVPTGYAILVYATNNILTGRSFVKNFYRFIMLEAAAETSPAAYYGAWNTYFSNLLVEGATIFVRARIVHVASGFSGVPVTASVVVTNV